MSFDKEEQVRIWAVEAVIGMTERLPFLSPDEIIRSAKELEKYVLGES